jgi:mannose-1-phosphate guanylyltransferase
MKALLLAAGLGTRLKPLTNIWPKCLMPIQGKPLLEYWLGILQKSGVNDILVNTHHLSEQVENFIQQSQFDNWVKSTYEIDLLGTAGTIRKNIEFCKDSAILLIHADNWVCCDFTDFLDYHYHKRPGNTVMTMMTFTCPNPSSCGIVELDKKGVVIGFYEKVNNPPGKLANAAVYLIEPEVIKWISSHPGVNDFSTEVLPNFLGKIATWKNQGIHKDIGTIEMLKEAQIDKCDQPIWSEDSLWQQEFLKNPVHKMVKR